MTVVSPGHGQLMAAVGPTVMREMNQRLLLTKLFDDGPATRPRLAQLAGLSQPTVFAALDDLERAGLVRQTGRPLKPQGRPAAVYEANPSAGQVIGVDIGRSWIHVALADLTGQIHAEQTEPNTAGSADTLVELVVASVSRIKNQVHTRRQPRTHTVIGSPGVLDPGEGRVLYAANLPGWHRSGVAQALSEQLGGSITIDNDANLAALAEHSYGAAQGVDDFAYIHIGTGLGVGLILGGQIYRGRRGAAGEVGYLPIGGDRPQTLSGQPMRGMLEEVLAADAVVRRARWAGLTGKVTAERVFRLAREGHPIGRQAVAEEGKHLAQLLAAVSAFIDPELIVVGGGIGQNLDLLLPTAIESLSLLTPMKPSVVVSALGSEAVVRGTIARGVTLTRELVFREYIAQAG